MNAARAVVPIAAAEPSQAARVRETAASLPLSARLFDDPAGAVVGVSGAGDWPDRAEAAIRRGALGVVVEDPDPSDIDSVRRLGARGGTVPVFLDRPYLAHPAVGGIRERWVVSAPEAAPKAELLKSVLTATGGTAPAQAMFRHLSFTRPWFGSADTIQSAWIGDDGYVVAGSAHACAQFAVTGALGTAAAPRLRLRLIAPPRRLTLQAHSPDLARPVTAQIVDEAGQWEPPTVYENGHRATWRRAIAQVQRNGADDAAGAADLAEFIADLIMFHTVLDRAAS